MWRRRLNGLFSVRKGSEIIERFSEQSNSFYKTGKVRIPEVLDIAYRLIKIINRLLEKEKTN